MIHYESEFVATDGTILYEQGWKPAGRIRSTVVLVHGYADHSGRYLHVAETLSRSGHAVAAFDLRGFGRSGGRRGLINSVNTFLDDVSVFRARIAMRDEPERTFLFGHSFGGALATLYCIEQAATVQGLLLSSPAIRLCEPAWFQSISTALGTLFPLLPTVPLDRSLVSSNPVVVQAALSDPLVYQGRVLAKTGASIVGAGRRIRSRMDELTTPFLVFHGTSDQLTDASGSKELYNASRSTDKTLHLLEGLLHETFNEPSGPRVLDQVVAWLDKRS